MILHHKILYGQKTIPFELEYRNRKTLEISVYPDLSVKVKAPRQRTIGEIKEKIHKRASWIMDQKYFFSLFLPRQEERKYFSGESHRYLGKRVRLKINQSDNEHVDLTRGHLCVYIKNRNDTYHIRRMLNQWYHNRASEIFDIRLIKCIEISQKYGIDKPSLQIRNMTKRWGSCSKKGILTLNSHLIKTSSYCIDYVIMHELCHLKYYNHGTSFYNLFQKIMPDWKTRKKKLESIQI